MNNDEATSALRAYRLKCLNEHITKARGYLQEALENDPRDAGAIRKASAGLDCAFDLDDAEAKRKQLARVADLLAAEKEYISSRDVTTGLVKDSGMRDACGHLTQLFCLERAAGKRAGLVPAQGGGQ